MSLHRSLGCCRATGAAERNKTDIGSPWDHWYAGPVVQGSAGHYWKPHFETELEFATAGQGTIAYQSIASLARVDPVPLSRGKVSGIASGAAGAAVSALLLFGSLLAYD